MAIVQSDAFTVIPTARHLRPTLPPGQLFDVEEFVESAKQDPPGVGEEVRSDDDRFVPVGAESFVSGKKSLFNVYIRLDNGRFLKILQRNDDFSPLRMQVFSAFSPEAVAKIFNRA